MKLIELFTKNLKPKQKQYEAVRAVAFGEGSIEEIARRFGYSPQSLRNLVKQVEKGERQLFPDVKPGPKSRRASKEVADSIIALRRQENLSSYQITDKLKAQNISIGVRTVERVLCDAGFPKLRRRTLEEIGDKQEGHSSA